MSYELYLRHYSRDGTLKNAVVGSVDPGTAIPSTQFSAVIHTKDGANLTGDAEFMWVAIGTE